MPRDPELALQIRDMIDSDDIEGIQAFYDIFDAVKKRSVDDPRSIRCYISILELALGRAMRGLHDMPASPNEIVGDFPCIVDYAISGSSRHIALVEFREAHP